MTERRRSYIPNGNHVYTVHCRQLADALGERPGESYRPGVNEFDRLLGEVRERSDTERQLIVEMAALRACIDAGLELLDPVEVHHIAGPLAKRIRQALTGGDWRQPARYIVAEVDGGDVLLASMAQMHANPVGAFRELADTRLHGHRCRVFEVREVQA
jgi:hypothetical protein